MALIVLSFAPVLNCGQGSDTGVGWATCCWGNGAEVPEGRFISVGRGLGFCLSFCIWTQSIRTEFKTSRLATAKENFKYLNVGLRQPLSSLLSKQSGNPLHCHPPGTHFPSAHMKFPGLLHSVVTLLPGSSWLSDGEEENRLLRLYSSKNWNAAFIPTARMGDSYRVHWVKIFKAQQTFDWFCVGAERCTLTGVKREKCILNAGT